MPMPPPKASTEGPRDRHVTHEMGQLVRALEEQGPQDVEELRRIVGGAYWEGGRFERAVALAVADGMLVQGPDDRLQAV